MGPADLRVLNDYSGLVNDWLNVPRSEPCLKLWLERRGLEDKSSVTIFCTRTWFCKQAKAPGFRCIVSRSLSNQILFLPLRHVRRNTFPKLLGIDDVYGNGSVCGPTNNTPFRFYHD